MSDKAQHTVAFDTVRQQQAARVAGMCMDALEGLGADSRATIILWLEGDKITYGIAAPKSAWGQVLVLGTLSVQQPLQIGDT